MANGSYSIIRDLLFEMKGWLRFLMPSRYIAPYYPTPEQVTHRMLKLASISENDKVYDLGCGDGRVLITAALSYKAKGTGVELDRMLAKIAQDNVTAAGLQHMIQILHCDAALVSVNDASVITLYLSESGNYSLLQTLEKSMRPGVRVVSYCFPIKSWEKYLVKRDLTDNLSIYLYQR